MTLLETTESKSGHVAEIVLRRYRAGELPELQSAETDRHLAACAACRSKLRLLIEEQRAFEREMPFERFAGGVERACRVPRQRPRRIWYAGLGGALAAAAVVLFLVRSPSSGIRGNRPKGGCSGMEATVRVAPARTSAQRSVPAGSQEVLEPGDRVRFGYCTAEPRYLAAVSIDDHGQVTLLYPEAGPALAVAATEQTVYLPESLEFTGAGREKVFLFLARKPFDSAAAKQAVKTASMSAKGDLRNLPNPTFAGGQQVFSWLFRKP